MTTVTLRAFKQQSRYQRMAHEGRPVLPDRPLLGVTADGRSLCSSPRAPIVRLTELFLREPLAARGEDPLSQGES